MKDKEIINEIKQDFKMNDKEKKIEEMAKVLPDRIINKTWRAKEVAEELYDIAVPEDSVVLTREEAERLLACEHNLNVGRESYRRMEERAYATIEDLKNELKQARKETAEKIIAMLKQPPYIDFVESWVINELAKQFGVEIKE